MKIYTGGICSTNGYLWSYQNHNVLIDAPEGITDWLIRKKYKVDVLFLTHQHFDHVIDAQKIKTHFQCPIFAYQPMREELTLQKAFSNDGNPSFYVAPFEVDHTLKDHSHWTWKDITLPIYHVPGHSPDSICLHEPDSLQLFSGDTLFEQSIGRTDLPGGSHRQLITGIKSKLLVLPAQTQVHPGHGDSTTIAAEQQHNPFLK
jgi:glyoxylase-like metal-dependent hydrolase (beta-lactamase superfamily II)